MISSRVLLQTMWPNGTRRFPLVFVLFNLWVWCRKCLFAQCPLKCSEIEEIDSQDFWTFLVASGTLCTLIGCKNEILCSYWFFKLFLLFLFPLLQWLTVCQTCPCGFLNTSREAKLRIWLAASIWAETSSIPSNGTKEGMNFTDICLDKIRSSKRSPSKEWKST